ncbi:hypothetical protein [Tepidimonas alkaliphilus]|nr:hypothetical protein [Tepidimonas alkaliphilus]
MTKVAKVGVSLLIVLGVAPLLFTQVIYDPQWYVSNVLSGAWVIAFIATLIVGYCAWFVFYYANREGARRHVVMWAWLALALFVLDGLIMHALAYQALRPQDWVSWYAPGGIVDTSGSRLHAIDWPRFVFMISLSLPAVGVFLLAYAQYVGARSDRTSEEREWVARLGRRLAVAGWGLSALTWLIWQWSQPELLRGHPVGWALGASLVAMGLWLWRWAPGRAGWGPLAAGVAVLLLLAVWREVVRVALLGQHGYSILDYPVHPDEPSTWLFFSTLLGIGGLVGGFYLTLLYRAGRTVGLYRAEPVVARLGTAAVAVLVLWIAVFFLYGIVIWLRNSFL